MGADIFLAIVVKILVNVYFTVFVKFLNKNFKYFFYQATFISLGKLFASLTLFGYLIFFRKTRNHFY